MAVSVVSSVQKWKEFLTRYYKNKILELAASEDKTKSLEVSFHDIYKFDVRLSEALINSPSEVLKHAEDALSILDLPLKKQIIARVRIVHIPRKTQIRDLRSDHINMMISVEGTIRKITDVRPRILNAAFECARCGNIIYIVQEGTGKFIEPSYCTCNEEKKGVFRLLFKESAFQDYQRIKIQESPEELKGGEQPQTLDINVTDDLAGRVTPGERVCLNGILRSAQRINRDGKTTYFDIYMDCNSMDIEEQEFDEVEITPEDEKQILKLSKDPGVYQKVVKSIAPSIYGYEEVKEAIALQLFSGVVKNLPDGTRIRGDIHILLVGDPGIAKSQILRYVVKLAPRGVYASGKSASSAGLTAAAVKDDIDGHWTLEAGALVLADKGVASVDEMDKMKNEDRSSLHEAMEQQSYHPMTEIMLADGRKVRIGAYVDALMKKNAGDVIEGIDCEILPRNNDEFVYSTDMSGIIKLPVDRVSRHIAPDYFIGIQYANGGKIIVTPEHPVFIVKDGIACIPANKVKKGDLVPAPFTTNGAVSSQDYRPYSGLMQKLSSSLMLSQVRNVFIIPNDGAFQTDYVYDITVEPTHSFISQGVVLHNTISVAKAGIMATLKCRCSLLGAANPKLGRFDPFENISEQINMPPSLMSRFDLIFILLDKPEETRDQNIATHILKSHYAGELNEHRKNISTSTITEEQVKEAIKPITPEIDDKLLRKYIAYARRKVFPVMNDDAKERIIKFYLELRKQGEGDNAPIAVTARQLEGLVRLAEASARLRLKDKVTIADVEKTIDIVMTSLRQVGMDKDTGKLDIDILTVGVGRSQRERIKDLKHLIESLAKEHGGSVSLEKLIEKAEEHNIKKDKVEKEVKKLKEIGEIYEPKPGQYNVS